MRRLICFFASAVLAAPLAVSAQSLIISEVGDLSATIPDAGGSPIGASSFIEITNVGGSTVNLADYDLGVALDGAVTWSTLTLGGSLGAGQSYVIADPAGQAAWEGPIGFAAADLYNAIAAVNGNDAIALLQTGTTTVVDIYGELGVDGAGTGWEYATTRVYRRPSVTAPNATFTPSEWGLNPPGDLSSVEGGGPESATEVFWIANPGRHNFGMSIAVETGTGSFNTPTPTPSVAIDNADLLAGLTAVDDTPTLFPGQQALHGAATGGLAVLNDGLPNGLHPAEVLHGLLRDPNGDGVPSVLTYNFASDFNIKRISFFTNNTNDPDVRVYLNAHIYLDTNGDGNYTADEFWGEARYNYAPATNVPAVNTTADWAVISVTGGGVDGSFTGTANVRGVRFLLYAPGFGTETRGEGNAATGTIVKEIDVVGDTTTDVRDWTLY